MNNSQIVAKDPQDEKILYPEFNKLQESCVHVGHVGLIFRFYGELSLFSCYLSTFLQLFWS